MVDIEDGLVRVLDRHGDTVGTGFVVLAADGGHRIITSAHVVLGADGLPDSDGPPESMRYVFHGVSEPVPQVAELDLGAWRPVAGGDIAVSIPSGKLPPGVEALVLGHAEHAINLTYRTFGFPEVRPAGMLSSGKILGMVPVDGGGRELQLQPSPEIAAGFSGAPILAVEANRVVGMIAYRTGTRAHLKDEDSGPPGGDAIFAVSSESIQRACAAIVPSDVCPFRGLASFEEADSEFFSGRDDLVGLLLDRLATAPRMLALFGPSGSGKTSLVRAGLKACLETKGVDPGPSGADWTVLVTRPADASTAHASRSGPAEIGTPGEMVSDWRGDRGAHDRLLLVVDQLEEVFAVDSTEHRANYISELVAIADCTAGDVTVLLVMRSDFMGRLDDEGAALQRRLSPENRLQVMATLDRRALAAMVVEPVSRVGLRYQEGLVDKIIRDTIEAGSDPTEPGVARSSVLPLLEDALQGLWHRRREGELTHDAYHRIEGVPGALPHRAEAALTRLSPRQQGAAHRILTSLVYLGDLAEGRPDTGRRRARQELLDRADDATVAEEVLEALATGRLIATAVVDRQSSVELIHDVLIRKWATLGRWLEADRQSLRLHQKVEDDAAEWEASNRDRAYLLRGERLDDADRLLNDASVAPSATVRAYLRASSEQRRRRRFAVVTVFTLLVGLLVVASSSYLSAERARRTEVEARGDAEHQSLVAHSRQLAAQSAAQLVRDLELSQLLAIESLRFADALSPTESFEGRAALYTSQAFAPRLVTTLHGPRSEAPAFAFSPDGTKIAAGGWRQIQVWDAATWTPLAQTSVDDVTSLTFSPDGTLLATSGYGEGITLWDPDNMERRGRTGDLGGTVRSIAFSPDGQTLAVATSGRGGGVTLWAIPRGQPHRRLASPLAPRNDPLHLVGFNPWDISRRSPIGRPLPGLSGPAQAVAFSPDGVLLAFGGRGGTVTLMDVASQRAIAPPLTADAGWVRNIAFSPDGRLLAIRTRGHSDGGTIALWDVESRTVVGELQQVDDGSAAYGAFSGPQSMAFDPTGEGLAFVGGTRDATSISIWSVWGEQLVGQFTGVEANTNPAGVAFKSDGTAIAASTMSFSANPLISIWDVSSQVPLGVALGDGGSATTSVAFSRDGSLLASGTTAGTIELWDVDTRKAIGTPMEGHDDWTRSLAFDPQGTILASGGGGTIVLWDVASRAPIGEPLDAEVERVNSLAFSPDGGLLASAGSGADGAGTIVLWDVPTRTPRHYLRSDHAISFSSVAFSPDGSMLAAASSSVPAELLIWDVATLAPPRRLKQPVSDTPDEQIEFSPDGSQIVSVRSTGQVVLWDVDGRASTLHRVPEARFSIAFSPDGTIVVVGIAGGVTLWDVAAGAPLGDPLLGHPDWAVQVAVNPEGTLIASGGADGVVVWPTGLDVWRGRSCDRARRNLTASEWNRYLPNQPYRLTCPQYPPGEGIDLTIVSLP